MCGHRGEAAGRGDPFRADAQALQEIRRAGRNGDWLVIRGYHVTDNMVSAVTGTPWSHAAVLDLDNDRVIEAEAPGVHFTPLAAFVAKSHRLLLVRPLWSNEKTAPEALARARSSVGKGYDFLGLTGVDVPERFYCWSWRWRCTGRTYRPDSGSRAQ